MEGTGENERSVAIELAETLAIAAAVLSKNEYSSSVVGDVIILTPTGSSAGTSASDE